MATSTGRWERYNKWLYLFFKILLFAACGLGILLVLVRVRSLAIPVLFALFVAYQINPLVNWAERHRVPRAASTVALLLAVIAGVVVFLVLFIPRFVGEFADLVEALPAYADAAHENLGPWFAETFGVDLSLDVAHLQGQLQEHASALLQPTGDVLGSVVGGVLGVLVWTLNLLLIPVFIFFLSNDYPRIVTTVQGLIPPRNRALVSRVAGQIDRALSSFVRGQLTVTAFLALFYSVGLAVIGVKYAVFIGVLAGFANLIPYVGVALGVALAAIMTLLEWSGFGPLIGVGALFIVGNLLENFVLTPKIVGDRVGLSPLLVLVALLFWGELFGILGVLIAIPVTAVLRVLLMEAVLRYRESGFFLRGAPNDTPPPAPRDGGEA